MTERRAYTPRPPRRGRLEVSIAAETLARLEALAAIYGTRAGAVDAAVAVLEHAAAGAGRCQHDGARVHWTGGHGRPLAACGACGAILEAETAETA